MIFSRLITGVFILGKHHMLIVLIRKYLMVYKYVISVMLKYYALIMNGNILPEYEFAFMFFYYVIKTIRAGTKILSLGLIHSKRIFFLILNTPKTSFSTAVLHLKFNYKVIFTFFSWSTTRQKYFTQLRNNCGKFKKC